jgi:ZIP family zinc transporter
MLNAFLWGLFACSSLILGGVIASQFSLSKKTIGMILGFGSGALISAVAYELIFESINMARMTGFPALGFFTGASTFFLADRLIERFGAGDHMSPEKSQQSRLMMPMVLAIILDGVPESLVIGLGLYEKGFISLSLLVAVFISNLPESISGSTGMKASGWSGKKIILLWLGISLVCAVSTVIGFSLFAGVDVRWLAFTLSFAGGAILMMIANSMIPEAYEHAGKLAGVFTMLGFFVAVSIIVHEHP